MADFAHQLEQTWSQLGISPSAQTLKSDKVRVPEPAGDPPALRGPYDLGGEDWLEIVGVLGEGGMGVVHAARQLGIGRTVAVKTAVPLPSVKLDEQLLQEGRITGLLEHPNIVPIYAIGHDANRRPMIVMKHIEGTQWSTSMEEEPVEARMRSGVLAKHLGILRQVAIALHFAHSRGILHRDVKPDNVMVGSFGEVYLVDWGIAVCTDDAEWEGVPRASDRNRIEGTPIYMSPEMASGEGAKLGVHSDVYLLGANLHMLITGEAPHQDDNIRAILLKAFVSKPPVYDAHVPDELARIATRAMARDPADRFETAMDFATAIDDFLLHREAIELNVEAERRTRELEGLIRSDAEDDLIDELFYEARFAYDRSLRVWPENTQAGRGRGELLELMARCQVARGRPEFALSLLRLHESAPAALVREADELCERQAEERLRVETLQHDADLHFGAQARRVRTYLGAVAWAALCVVAAALTKSGVHAVNHIEFAGLGLFLVVGNVAATFTGSKIMLANAANRALALTSLVIFASSVALWPILGAMGLSMANSSVLSASSAGILWCVTAIHRGRAWLGLGIAHFVVAVGAALWPEYHFEIYGLVAIPSMVVGYLDTREAPGSADVDVE